MYNKELGNLGENEATKYLINQGYIIVEKNFMCYQGEIDIIAIDKDEYVFIEVKTRISKIYGRPIDAINENKKKHIKNATKYYIYKNKLTNLKIRFDVIEIYIKKNKFYINHLKNLLW